MNKRPYRNTTVSEELFVIPQGKIRDSDESILITRFIILGVCAFLFLAIIAGKSGYLAMAESMYRTRAEDNRIRTMIQYAPRGIFFDTHGVQLVKNVPSTNVVAWEGQLPEDKEEVLSILVEIFPDISIDELRSALLSNFHGSSRPIPLVSNITDSQRVAVLSRTHELPGIGVENRAVREYSNNGTLSHVLGYTGKISAEERKNRPDYLLTEIIGKSGIERQYEEVLRGIHGAKRVEVNALGEIVSDLGVKEPIPGASIKLHIDAEIQHELSKILEAHTKTAGKSRAAAVVLDPQNGEVRAMVSLPQYDHTALSRGGTGNDAFSAFTDPERPLINRALQGRYPPGSLFKIPVAAAILEQGIARPHDTVHSTGGISVGQWRFPDWKHGGHGTTNIRKAIAESVNTYFYVFGGGYDGREGLGVERISAWAERMSFGKKTGIDMPSESEGFLPSRQWKKEQRGEPWYIGDTYHLSIGQGFVTVTPMQLAVATAAIANGGTVYTPRVADALVQTDGTVIEHIRHEDGVKVLSRENAQVIREGMRQAVTDGSAARLSLLATSTAGKTGTAQTGRGDATHAWFTSFAPYENPEVVIVILVEEGGGGEKVAVPIAHEFYQWYFKENTDPDNP